MMRWLYFIVLLTLSLFTEASLPSGIIRGKVFDNNTLEPLPGVSILFKRNQGTTTDANGYYIIRIQPGHVNIHFQHIGYEPIIKSLNINSNDTIELNIGLELHSTEINQLVISASKVEQKISELTVSMSVIEPKLLSSNHITDATVLINKTSGVEVLDGQASIRGGSGFSYGAGSRVLMLIDGLPVLSADAGDIKWYSLPLENISQIEIIKGASSVLYGSSALNGVINFRTSDAKDKPETKFFVETGIFDKPQQKKWVWWSTPRSFSTASLSHLKKYGNTDIGFSSHFQLDNGYRKLNDEKLGRVGIRIRQHNQKVDGLTYGLNINSNLVNKTDFILWEEAEYGALKQSETTAIEMSAFFLTLDPYISFKKKDRLTHDLRIRLQSIQNDFPTASNNNSTARSLFSEYQFWYKASDFMNINAGILQYSSQIISEFYGNHNGQNYAGYSQLNMNPHNRLKVVAGARFEYNALDDIYDKPVVLFRAGINYRVKDYTFFRASFGQGYRYPSIAEKHASTTLGAVRIFPNPFIKAESGWNSELGIKQGILTSSINGMVDVALFYSQNKDMIEYVFGVYPGGLGFRATNIEYSRVYGGEIEFNLNFNIGKFQNYVKGGYVFMYPVEYNPYTNKNTDVFLKFRRKHSGKVSINSSIRKIEFGLDFYSKSRILEIDDVFVNPETREIILPGFYDYWVENNNGYALLDLNTSYRVNQKFMVSFVIKNIGNTEYMGRPGDIMPHRNFSIRLTGKL
jgi:iron complex outermembrane receptor protein